MTVWVVQAQDYETSDILSIHATEAGAKKAAERASAHPPLAGCSIDYEAYEVLS